MSQIITPSPTLFVAPRYSVNLDRVRQTTASQLLRDALEDHAVNRHNLRAEFINAQAKTESRHACERVTTTTKFFFDHDGILEPGRDPEESKLEHMNAILEETLRVLQAAGIPDPPIQNVHIAQRHGHLSDGRFKISFRVYVTGYRTDLYSIKTAVQVAARRSNRPTLFDTSVYSRNRRLCMILGVKTNEDTRKLMPVRREVDEGRPLDQESLEAYVVQHVSEEWPFIHVDPHADYRMTEGVVDVVPSSQNEEAAERPRQRQRTDEEERDNSRSGELFKVVKDTLRNAGFTNARQVGADVYEGNAVILRFDCDCRSDCPICHQDHEHNLWALSIDKDKGLVVYNHSTRCKKTPLMSDHFLHPFMADVFSDVTVHMQYAECYLESREGTLLFNQGTGQYHEFKDQKWRETPDELVMESMRTFINKQLLEPQVNMVREWKSTAKKLKMGEKVTERLDFFMKQANKARSQAGSYPFLTNLLKMAKGMCFAESTRFNREHDVLHFDNGVLDLETTAFRDTVAEDYNTMTVRYEYNTQADPAHVQLHRDFMEKIYPDPGHREVAQRVMGATLTGYNNGKKLFIFTDNGGEFGGNNGKTKVFGLHMEALGDYGIVAKKDFMYDTNQSSGEGASPFTCKLASKRCVLLEELEPNKKLAEGTVKEWTNGTNAILPVRDLYKGSKTIEMCAKIMVGCNHGKFPR